jgi:Undecaprenyl-phosphate glucose phosphotransferase
MPAGNSQERAFDAFPDHASAADHAQSRLISVRGLLSRFYPLLSELWQLLDIGVVISALYLVTRAHGTEFGDKHVALIAVSAALMFAVYSWSDLFYRLRTRSLRQEAARLLHAWVIVLVLLIAIGYLTQRQHLFPRDFILTWGTLAYGMQLLVHVCVRNTLHFLRRRGYNVRRALVVGCGAPLERCLRLINQNPWLGIRVDGYVAELGWLGEPALANSPAGAKPKRLGGLDDVARLVDELSISEIYVALPLERSADAEIAVRALVNVPVNVNWLPDFSVAQVLSTRSDELGGQPLVLLSDSRIERHGRLFKRVEDTLLSSLLIILFSPVMLAIALAIRCSSPGPVLFRQQRLGIGGQRITVWKFRTMRAMPQGEIARQASPGDDRITPIGRWLRRWSLDELPQLFNVWEGSMSLIGPRPHPLWLNDRFSKVVYAYMQRHRVKPGITGWAQVSGYRGETETPEKMNQRVKYDLYYITHWSPWLDLCILMRTVAVVIRGDNAH